MKKWIIRASVAVALLALVAWADIKTIDSTWGIEDEVGYQTAWNSQR